MSRARFRLGGVMTIRKPAASANRLTVMIIAMAFACAITSASAAAQSAALRNDGKAAQPQAATAAATASDNSDPYFKDIYRNFYSTYKLGPADEVAIRIVGQPDYTIEKAQVSPVGRVYHPLIGD